MVTPATENTFLNLVNKQLHGPSKADTDSRND